MNTGTIQLQNLHTQNYVQTAHFISFSSLVLPIGTAEVGRWIPISYLANTTKLYSLLKDHIQHLWKWGKNSCFLYICNVCIPSFQVDAICRLILKIRPCSITTTLAWAQWSLAELIQCTMYSWISRYSKKLWVHSRGVKQYFHKDRGIKRQNPVYVTGE